MLRLLRLQSGFSLVQGMVLGSVIAGSALVATRLITDQKLAMKGAETRDQVEQLHSLVYAVLQNKDNCYATVKGIGGGTDVSAQLVGAMNPTMNRIVANTHTTATATGTTYDSARIVVETNAGASYDGAKTYMNGNVRIKSINWQYPAPIPEATVTNPNPVAPGAGIAYLNISYERLKDDSNSRMKKGLGAKDLRKTIAIRLQRTSTGAFDGCYASTEDVSASEKGNKDLAKQMCEQLNSTGNSLTPSSLFVWDEATSTCKPKELTCKRPGLDDGYVNTGINSNGQVECRKLVDWTDVNNFIDNSSPTPCTAGLKAQLIAVPGNKVKILCTP